MNYPAACGGVSNSSFLSMLTPQGAGNLTIEKIKSDCSTRLTPKGFLGYRKKCKEALTEERTQPETRSSSAERARHSSDDKKTDTS